VLVTGCADIKLTVGMWRVPVPGAGRRQQQDDSTGAVNDARDTHHFQRHQQEREVAVIRCNSSAQSWRLTCRDNIWVGQLGNCSPASAAKRETKSAHTAT